MKWWGEDFRLRDIPLERKRTNLRLQGRWLFHRLLDFGFLSTVRKGKYGAMDLIPESCIHKIEGNDYTFGKKKITRRIKSTTLSVYSSQCCDIKNLAMGSANWSFHINKFEEENIPSSGGDENNGRYRKGKWSCIVEKFIRGGFSWRFLRKMDIWKKGCNQEPRTSILCWKFLNI